MSAVIEWSDPPVTRSGPKGTKWLPVARQLMERPGEWAKISESGRSSDAPTLRKALAKAGGTFEATARLVGEKRWGYWARYVGSDAAPAVTTSGTFPDVKSNVVTLPPAKAKAHPSTQPAPNGPKADSFECELCDPPKVFTDRHTLRHHQRVSHRCVVSAEKLALPVQVLRNGVALDLYDASGGFHGTVYSSTHRIPIDVAQRAAEAAAAVINEAMTPAWTWAPGHYNNRHRYLLFKGVHHDTLVATDAMVQLTCDAYNAAGVEP